MTHWPWAAKITTAITGTVSLLASLIALGQFFHWPCLVFGDELHLSTHDEWDAQGVHRLVAEVWGGKPCDDDDQVWIVGKVPADRPWFPYCQAGWDIDRGMYTLSIRDEQEPSTEMHLVVVDEEGARSLKAWPPDGDYSIGLEDLPEGSDQGVGE